MRHNVEDALWRARSIRITAAAAAVQFPIIAVATIRYLFFGAAATPSE